MKRIILSLLLGFIMASQVATAQQSRGEQADTTKREVEEDVSRDVYTIVEEMPEFPGGEKEMMRFLATNIRYPKKALEAGASGRVIIKFIVNKEGEVVEAKVLQGIGFGCDEEALRVVNSMPKWKPGKQRGKAVNVYYTLPVRFELK